MKIFRMGLGIKIFLTFFITSSVLFAGMGYFLVQNKKVELNESLASKGALLTEVFVSFFSQAITSKNDLMILTLIQKLEGIEDVVYAILFNPEGKVIGHSDVYEIGKVMDDPLTKRGLKAERYSYVYYEKQGKSYYDCSIPIKHEGKELAFLRVGLDRTRIEAALEKSKKELLFMVSGFLFIVGGIYFASLWFRVIRPLSGMQEGLSFLSKNISSFSFKTKSQDEIGDVFLALEGFVDKVRAELGRREEDSMSRAQLEEERLEEILTLLVKDKKLIIADHNNRVLFCNISQPAEAGGKESSVIGMHLLDLIKEEALLQLLNKAINKKDNVAGGDVEFEGKSYTADVLVISGRRALENKTIIFLGSS